MSRAASLAFSRQLWIGANVLNASFLPLRRRLIGRKAPVYAALASLILLASASTKSQSTPAPRGAQHAPILQWEIDAGGKMAFDVASVKQDLADPTTRNMTENVTLDAGAGFKQTGGLFRATNIPLHWYIRFAYKLSTTEFGEIMDELPRWALTNRYDIEARAPGEPTKDQYRLMVQTLLADRFKLAVHFETRQMPTFALVLDKPGKLGPRLRKHDADVRCPEETPGPGPVSTIAGGFPLPCVGFFDVPPRTDGDYAGGARDVPMSRIADIFSLGTFRTYRPVVDETELAGTYDFVIEFARDESINPNGPTFADALKEQLGLKLKASTGPVHTIFVDHIEEFSPN